ncbi:hopanoid-associated phosphorylase [Paraburkholderia silvatlantica]|uniref:Futalosine hydrolase n=2 Tax=Paraburkholderia silvatlantica TaxID=321895 RepID=A0A2U1AFR8_9BURK|nr:phosphorylase [Paraburkholderia silvatlantica]MBB2928680.1 hopanoid-associated phosphorylase [Paraburkholderia silvatlantica]PVY35265.1 futalosine hydrolase [Paraburkholderia silvatlantica]PXW40907.1 futalosine hydrolase [Paraburkholderia silvatlantica]PYE27373.1 futalosine hydrolase [Paraburkholderia silvatlantica]TDQ98267.1 futalosine hydrolase [Paraburkholderia silvatlantica]
MSVAAGVKARALPVIAVTGMAFEAGIAAGKGQDGVRAVYAARADLLQSALAAALKDGAAGIVSFGTAGGLAPDLEPGTLVIAQAIEGPFGRVEADADWSARMADALMASPLAAKTRRGVEAAVAAPLTGAADKAALFSACGALAVDMESHLAAAAAAAHGVPFAVCRAIVDPAWRSLPKAAMAGLRDDGTTAVLPVLRELARDPAQLGGLLRVAADAKAARQSLSAARQVLTATGAFFPK